MEVTYNDLLSKPMLSVHEMARVSGVNHKTIREMIAQGKLEAVRLGRTLRIPTRAARELLSL